MTETHDMGNLETPITGEIPEDIPDDGGSGPSTETQILEDADLTDIPEPTVGVTDDLDESPVELPESDSTLSTAD